MLSLERKCIDPVLGLERQALGLDGQVLGVGLGIEPSVLVNITG